MGYVIPSPPVRPGVYVPDPENLGQFKRVGVVLSALVRCVYCGKLRELEQDSCPGCGASIVVYGGE